ESVNKGGLECKVGNLRAFLPSGQIDRMRVDNPEQYINEKWKCVVTECNPERRNLVISRRKLIEQERAEMAEKLWDELEVGQTRNGTIVAFDKKDTGAFVNLGGLDGYLHVSQMGWGRVASPRDVVKIGDCVTVHITKIDREKERISVSLKNEDENPWKTVETDFKKGDTVRGRVANIIPAGAFVELKPGVDGFVHISEISYKRVENVSDALQIGDWVDAVVKEIEFGKQRISLSIKMTQPDPRKVAEQQAQDEAVAKAAEEEAKAEKAAAEVRERIKKRQFKGELKGGLGGRDDNGTGLHF
ncbi:MAG: S1 RNA-binding domain-containing protein, partial [Thermoguttaceae bacterium]|nr:S1 RNA-binding domain-containing protein [Thermoguttaceae bacterium]